jgi:hypothetical protein
VIRNAAPLVQPALSDLISLSGPALALLHEAPALIREADAALPAISRFTVAFNNLLVPVLNAAKQVVPVIDFMQPYKKSIVAGMANLAAITNASSPGSLGEMKYFRASLVLPDTFLLGQSAPPSDARLNPYPSPGEMNNIKAGALESATCANVNNTTLESLLALGSNVPCTLQKYAWGSTAPTTPSDYYPHVTAAQ